MPPANRRLEPAKPIRRACLVSGTGTRISRLERRRRGRTWTILTPARASTGPGELSVLVSGGCPSVPRWFHPHVKSCARQEEAQSKTGQNENSEQRGSRASGRSRPAAGKGGGGTHASVVADGEGVAAAGDDGGDAVGLQGLHAVGPVLLLAPAHAQLPVLPGPPAASTSQREISGGRVATS